MKIILYNENNQPSTLLDRMQSFKVKLEYDVRVGGIKCFVSIMIDKIDRSAICHTRDTDLKPNELVTRKKGRYSSIIEFPGGLLNAGHYKIRVEIAQINGVSFDHLSPLSFHLIDLGSFASGSQYGRQRPGILAPLLKWDTVEIDKLNYISD